MKVKKYTASTMPEIMKKIRVELGEDAVILHSKEINQGGFLGLFKKKKVEVVAAVDPTPLKKDNKPKSDQLIRESSPQRYLDAKPDRSVLQEIQHVKKLIETQHLASNTSFPANYEIVYQHLCNQEISEQIGKKIIEILLEDDEEGVNSLAEISQHLRTTLSDRLTDLPFHGMNNDHQVFHFIGPTGVGKTTTIAKIAANCMLKDKKSVAFITMDTYRIAAIEQLKTYAQILDVPIKVAYSLEDYKEAINELRLYDYILVDTAGRNYRDDKYIHDLKPYLSATPNNKSYLVLSLTSKPNDLLDVYEKFNKLPINQVIFTKMDETKQYGSLLNMIWQKNVGVAYITNGQDVPDDLLQPQPEQIIDFLLEGLEND